MNLSPQRHRVHKDREGFGRSILIKASLRVLCVSVVNTNDSGYGKSALD
jgi:hypothetical protein